MELGVIGRRHSPRGVIEFLSESRITLFFLSMSPRKMKRLLISTLEVMVKVVNLEILDILLFPESSQQLCQ